MRRFILAGVVVAVAVAGSACSSPAASKLTSFQLCVQAFEQHPEEDLLQVVPATPACQQISGVQAITAELDASRHVNPATAKP